MLVLLIAFGLPGVFFAWSVMLVPPARSMPSRGVTCSGPEHPAREGDHGDQEQGQGAPWPAWGPCLPSALVRCCHLLVSPCPTAPRRCVRRSGHEVLGTCPRRNQRAREPRCDRWRRPAVTDVTTSRRPRRRPCRPWPRSWTPPSPRIRRRPWARRLRPRCPWPRRPRGLGVVGLGLLDQVDPGVVRGGGAVGSGQRGSVVRNDRGVGPEWSSPWTMRLYSSSSRTAPIAFLA